MRPGLAVLILGAGPALAESPWDRLFPTADSCYARAYSASHLAAHPSQRVTAMTLAPDPAVPGDPLPAVRLRVELRGPGGGAAEAVAYCEGIAGGLSCGMEGDAGAFAVTEAQGGAILVSVARDGMTFETAAGFVTLEREAGDDRSFLLRPGRDCD